MTGQVLEVPPIAGAAGESIVDYRSLNAMLNIYGADGRIQFEADRAAVREYFRQHVLPNTVEFGSLEDKLRFLVSNEYYEAEVFEPYRPEFVEELFDQAAGYQFRFATFMGAYKFYQSYALKTFDGKRYLEGFEDRVCLVALTLAGGDEALARGLVEEIVAGRFQPATPTFLNAGKKQRGESVSCFLIRVEDTMESISRGVNAALQLSKRGGGVSLLLSNVREAGAPIKKIENQSSGVVPIMKLLEDSFSYANQLGARQGAGAVYLSAHHPDIMRFLDTKRENADEKIRIKTLSLGVVVPDITFQLAKAGRPMSLFSPYDVERVYGKAFADVGITEHYDQMVADPRIRKTEIDARGFFQTLAEIQFESGYPYLLFEDTATRANPLAGRITHSNLCSEILQISTPSSYNEDLSYSEVGKDICCNLGSLNIAAAVDSPDLGRTVEIAVRALTAVSESAQVGSVPSVERGNQASHAIGLGQMNLHGFLGRERIHYGSPEALDFTDVYFATIAYHALRASNRLAQERGQTFEGFADSSYASGRFFDRYVEDPAQGVPTTPRVNELVAASGWRPPSRQDWLDLRAAVVKHGLFNAYLQAVPPTGSISYINNSTASIHPIAARVEIRKEGKIGRVYYPAPHMDQSNLEYFEDAYAIGPEKIIDTYAAASRHVDQGLSLTLFFPADATTRDINRAQIYAWSKGIKTIYYVRLRQEALEGTQVEGCVSCAL
ncbi:MAG: class 1b ribonucleoside-diphosphate reductase subunit alpha [Bifidobacteriaceae bacterium]|jgi:ribonucleoside-diphosphate reductase alpha chain|nr:class 1b ribonucleoside-diphosphate reductase subunit alpha [Bifidobacteriaceae bacterium]